MPSALPDLGVERRTVIAPLLGGVDVGGRLVVGLGEHGHHGEEDFLDRLCETKHENGLLGYGRPGETPGTPLLACWGTLRSSGTREDDD